MGGAEHLRQIGGSAHLSGRAVRDLGLSKNQSRTTLEPHEEFIVVVEENFTGFVLQWFECEYEQK